MEETQFAVGEKVTILDVKKVGEVIEVLEDGWYKVEYTDDAGVTQTETLAAGGLAPEGEVKAEGGSETAGTETGSEGEKSDEDAGREDGQGSEE